MPLSIDPQRTALLCMHLQNDVVAANGALKDFGVAAMVEKNDLLSRVARLQNAAREAGTRVVHVAIRFRPGYTDRAQNAGLWQAVVGASSLIEGTWGAEFHPGAAPAGADVIVANKGASAFTGSDLRSRLETSGIHALLLAGVATNFAVESTAREAADLGYEVTVVRDCCTSVSADMHEAALNTALPFLATISNFD
jgi:gluconolactonase